MRTFDINYVTLRVFPPLLRHLRQTSAERTVKSAGVHFCGANLAKTPVYHDNRK